MQTNPIYVSSWCGKLFCTSFSLILVILITNTYIPLLPFPTLYIFLYLLTVSVITVWITCVVIQKFLQRTKPLEYIDWSVKWIHKNNYVQKDLEERITEFSGDVQKFYIDKWFKHISDDETFCEESRIMIADVTRRFLQIVVFVDGKKLLHGVLLILLKHLKEFRRARKRCEKNDCDIEQAYRYSHVGSKSEKHQEFFLHKLTESFLKQFISWELWNSLPCRTLVAVLSHKLINYLLNYISKPGFINYRFLKLITQGKDLNLNKYSFVSVATQQLQIKNKPTAVETFTPRDSPARTIKEPALPKPKNNVITEPDFPKNIPVSEPVKIYEAKTATKTWRNSSDLECISLGQDLLVEEKKIWQEPSGVTNLMKPIENVTASIFQQEIVKPVSQATTSAINKIGDLQDEAAGVMEGIFDFGMAGIQKGLRLTGLQTKKTAKLPKWPQITSEDSNIWINPLNSPNFEGEILLEKSPVVEQKTIPQISTDSEHVDTSPEPEYEETADFATTIAKLRSLLQQKSSESSLNTPAVSPLPQDEKTTPQESTVDGVMPSLYKFCAKTATGMFQNTINTLKTALPGNTNEQQIVDNWSYVASDATSNDTISRVKRLLVERREFCTVDTACEAIDSLNIEDNFLEQPPPFDDDSDDFEQQIPLTKAVIDICCELIVDTNSSLVQESVVKIILVLIGKNSEDVLDKNMDKFIKNINSFIGKLPEYRNQDTLPMKFDKMLEICVASCPNVIKQILSEITVRKALELFLSSFQSQKINEDISLQIFELIAQQVIVANSQLTPAFSA